MASKFLYASATGKVADGPLYVVSVNLVAGASNALLVFDDSTDGSSANKCAISCVSGDDTHWHTGGVDGVYFEKGLYATLTGNGAVASFEVVV